MRSVLCIIILNLILINSTSAKENWTVEKVLNDEFISISTFGEVTHGDRYRLLINKVTAKVQRKHLLFIQQLITQKF